MSPGKSPSPVLIFLVVVAAMACIWWEKKRVGRVVKKCGIEEGIVYTTTRPNDIKTPYEKMLENDVEFGTPDKRSGWFLNSALVSAFVL
ncbi:hypothetical protein Tco_1519125 [Tanacetum coccineum]